MFSFDGFSVCVCDGGREGRQRENTSGGNLKVPDALELELEAVSVGNWTQSFARRKWSLIHLGIFPAQWTPFKRFSLKYSWYKRSFPFFFPSALHLCPEVTVVQSWRFKLIKQVEKTVGGSIDSRMANVFNIWDLLQTLNPPVFLTNRKVQA